MLYRFENNKIYARALEYSVAYHCNLKCAGCSHMSPFLEDEFPSLEGFRADIHRLQTVLHVDEIRLCGGEPLLNSQINAFIQIAKASGIADRVTVTTNGLRLHKMNEEFWRSVDGVTVTLYPDIMLKADMLKRSQEFAQHHNTKFKLYSNPHFRTTIVTQAHPKDLITDLIFKTCENVHLYHCHLLHEGNLYKCAVPPFLPAYLQRMGRNGYQPQADAFDIHAQRDRDFYTELKRFFLSNDTLESCRYCLGYLGKREAHRQLQNQLLTDPTAQPITRKAHLDRTKLLHLLDSQLDERETDYHSASADSLSTTPLRPKCSVIIPTYNRSKYIGRAINSVLNQTFQDFEILVIDDHSTDQTREIVNEFIKRDPRTQYYRLPENRGAQSARNFGIQHATGLWVAFLDSDDEWLPHRLEAGFELQLKTGYAVTYSACYRTDGDEPAKKIMNIQNLSGNIYKALLKKPNPMFQGLLVKRDCFDRIGFLDEGITAYQEWDTSIMLAKHFEFGFVPDPLFIYHCHSGETISKDMKRDADGWRQIVNKHKAAIVSENGIEQLREHYQTLAHKYNSLGLREIAQKYEELISILPDLTADQLFT
jgi:glycosyltransferase involved in cell wall biosynthesis/organic radical activating enzyme